MNELTREELLNIIETDHVQCGEAAYLARIALAAIDSEPVGTLSVRAMSYGGKKIGHQFGFVHSDAAMRVPDGDYPLYRHAQPTVDSEPVMFCSEETLAAARDGEHLLRTLSSPSGECVIPLYTTPQPIPEVDSEPVAYIFKHPAGRLFWALTDESNKGQSDVIPVYTAPQPAPVVPEEKPIPNTLSMYAVDAVAAIAEVKGWNACRAAMLAAAPQDAPALNSVQSVDTMPGKWIPVSERMPEKNQSVLISVNFDSSLVEPLICSARYTGSTFRRGDATVKPGSGIEQATHWMPLPNSPQEPKP